MAMRRVCVCVCECVCVCLQRVGRGWFGETPEPLITQAMLRVLVTPVALLSADKMGQDIMVWKNTLSHLGTTLTTSFIDGHNCGGFSSSTPQLDKDAPPCCPVQTPWGLETSPWAS